jgi:hypothetical protein
MEDNRIVKFRNAKRSLVAVLALLSLSALLSAMVGRRLNRHVLNATAPSQKNSVHRAEDLSPPPKIELLLRARREIDRTIYAAML